MAVGGGLGNVYVPSNFSKSLDRIFEDAQVTSELKLCGRKLKEFPKCSVKHNLSDTVIADLSKNRFSEVPSDVCEFESLEKLRLYHNVIKTLPESLANLQALSHLILSRNQLSVLPSCVCQLSSLQVLDVSGNRLVSLPEELGLLIRLTDLDASYNQLQVLPPSLGDLDDLRRLCLRRNFLQNIPTELCFLRLTCLDLSYNRISALPTELRFMSSLLNLLLEANPLSHPPANVCMRGRVHIFKWLDQSAVKEDKKRGVLSEVEFRKTRKYTKVPPSVSDFRLVNGFLDGRHKRSTVDSGYSTSDNGDARWSHGSQEQLCDPLLRSLDSGATKDRPRGPQHQYHPHYPTYSSSNYSPPGTQQQHQQQQHQSHVNGVSRMDSSSENTLSGHSTPSTLSPGDSFNLEDEFYKAMKLRQEMGSNNSSNSSSQILYPVQSQHQNGDDFSHGRMGPEGAASCRSPSRRGDASSSSSTINGHPPPQPTSPSRFHPPPNEHPHPHNPDPGGGITTTTAAPPSSPHPQVPTYREYLEAKRQQRAMEANNIYKRQGGDGVSPTNETTPVPMKNLNMVNSSGHLLPRPNPMGGPNNVKNILNGSMDGNNPNTRPSDLREDRPREMTRAHVKSIQKEAVLSYVKSRVSPSKSGSSPNSPNVSFDDSIDGQTPPSFNTTQYTVSSPLPAGSPQSSSTPYHADGVVGGGLRNGHAKSRMMIGQSPSSSATSPVTSIGVLKTRKRSGGGQPFDPDSTPSRLNFTYRRELEKQQHEKQLIDNLRSIIESRLKVSLPSDLSSALMDGVVLCHLVNHVRPRAVSSIHVPSPAVPKLTIAKCRLNVENFLEACRKIGVEEASLCSCDDIVTELAPQLLLATLRSLFCLNKKPSSVPVANRIHSSSSVTGEKISSPPASLRQNSNTGSPRRRDKDSGPRQRVNWGAIDSATSSSSPDEEKDRPNEAENNERMLSLCLLGVFLAVLLLALFPPMA